MMGRDRGASSFDINDCFTSRENQQIIDETTHLNSSVCKTAANAHFNQINFRR